MKSKRMRILSFQVGGKTHRFKEPLILEGEKMEVLCLTHEELSISACEKSWGACVDVIGEELTMLWEDYALAPDATLTADAIALKNKLLEMVEEAK